MFNFIGRCLSTDIESLSNAAFERYCRTLDHYKGIFDSRTVDGNV